MGGYRMVLFKDQTGTRTFLIDVGNAIAHGGEGDICNIQGSPDKVAKLFHDNTPTLKINALKNKVTYMAQTFAALPDNIRKAVSGQITWPEVALFDSNGNFRGYIMRKINGHETLDCAYAESQKVKSDFSCAEKVLIAKNLCIVVNIMHSYLHSIVGDFNAKNIMVSIRNGTVFLVDSDSFHLQRTSQIRGRMVTEYMPALVGRPEYLPKELHEYVVAQNARLDTLPQPSFNQESDLFGLAIHIFQLIMNGAHPFGLKINPAEQTSSFTVSKVDIGWAENIKKGRYVYSKTPSVIKSLFRFQPPEFAPSYDVFPPKLQELCERAFLPADDSRLKRSSGDGKYFSPQTVRPSAEDWYMALDDFSRQLIQCRKNPKHQYGNHLSKCPWCELEQKRLKK